MVSPRCITIHFMTEMGAWSSCSDDSVRPDSDTNDRSTMTLSSKDRHFYSFMVDTLDAGITCQARNDAVTFHPDNCGKFINYMRNYRAGSRCTYNTSSTGSDTELRYDYCLGYRLMKSLGAGSVCKDWTLFSMCSLFGFMKELLQEVGVSTDYTMIRDNDTISLKERWMLSDNECYRYSSLSRRYSECVGNSMAYQTDPDHLWKFTYCITNHFLTEVEATSRCSYGPGRSDSDTNDKNTMTLLSKDHLFYNFMADTLDAGNTCQVRNDAVKISPDNCWRYMDFVKDYHAESRCTYNIPSTNSDTELDYADCLDYRLMKSLGADSVCHVSLISTCDRFHNMVQSLTPTCICVIGLIRTTEAYRISSARFTFIANAR